MSEDLIKKYIDYYRRKKDKTKKDRKYILKKLRKDIGKPLDEVKRNDIQDWIDDLNKNRMKASSINQYLSIIKHFYEWLNHELPQPATQEEMREVFEKQKQFGKIQDIEMFEEENKEDKQFTSNQIVKLVRESVEGKGEKRRRVYGKAFVLYCYFGFRRDELRKLEKKHIDFDKRIVTIIRDNTKTQAGVRDVPFHPWIGKLMGESKGKYVVGGKKPYCQSNFHWKAYDNVLDFHFDNNTFRNTFDTKMRPILHEELGKAAGDYMLKKLMGHKTSGGDMTDHHFKGPEDFEEYRRKAMNQWHYFNKNNMFEKLEKILEVE